jgi:hypothetical protein
MNTDAHRFKSPFLFLSVYICVHLWLNPSSSFGQKWDKKWLTAIFYAEGANFGDFNKDGKLDVVSGPFIYDGPEFKAPHAYTDVVVSDPLAYSQNFFSFVYDFDKDGFSDICVVRLPRQGSILVPQPAGRGQPGRERGSEEGVGTARHARRRRQRVARADQHRRRRRARDSSACPAATPATRRPTRLTRPSPGRSTRSPPRTSSTQRFTHGIGVGDVNGDGKLDLLEKAGWWEQPEKLDDTTPWKQHAF